MQNIFILTNVRLYETNSGWWNYRNYTVNKLLQPEYHEIFINNTLEKMQDLSHGAESSGGEAGIQGVLGKHPWNEILIEVCCLEGRIFPTGDLARDVLELLLTV